MEEKVCNVVTLNGVEYTEIKRVTHNDMDYVLLTNLENPHDFCIKKLISKNDETFITGLQQEEFEEVFKLFNDKNLN